MKISLWTQVNCVVSNDRDDGQRFQNRSAQTYVEMIITLFIQMDTIMGKIHDLYLGDWKRSLCCQKKGELKFLNRLINKEIDLINECIVIKTLIKRQQFTYVFTWTRETSNLLCSTDKTYCSCATDSLGGRHINYIISPSFRILSLGCTFTISSASLRRIVWPPIPLNINLWILLRPRSLQYLTSSLLSRNCWKRRTIEWPKIGTCTF